MFSCEFYKISKNTFFTEHLLGNCFCRVKAELYLQSKNTAVIKKDIFLF